MKRLFALIALLLTPTLAMAELGDDGLFKEVWMRDTFKDMAEDLEEANTEGKRLMVIVEQRGCIYCTKMHNEVFSDPDVAAYIEDNYFVVQMNLFGDVEMTDFDGEALPEKEMAMKWGVMFTPTMLFFPQEVSGDSPANREAVAVMPGAFLKGTTLDLLHWVVEEGYDSGENFQKYHARKINERRAQ